MGHGAVELGIRRAGLRRVGDATSRTTGYIWPAPVPLHPQRRHRQRSSRSLQRSEPDRLWATDITEHRTREAKIYYAVVSDVFSRRVVGWSIDSSPTAALVTNALKIAIDQRQPAPGSTAIHSDQESPYTS